MKPLNWVELTRQQIKARHGFGWSIQGIEKQNKVITKIVYRFSNGQRSTVITDIEWNTNNSKKIQDLIIEFETLMNERHVDLKKAYELIIGNKVFSDKNNYAPSAAALINGTLAHSLDFDDTHAEASLHSSAPILSAALSAAQMKDCSGQQLITACVIGYEIQIRLGLAGGASKHYNRGFHPTATCGIFGAVAATGHILGLNKDQFISAYGIALSQSSGSMEFLNDGSWTKRSHVGQAAQNGLKCAVLALEGFKGPQKAFEGKWGYLNSFVSGGDSKKALNALGENFETLNLGVKPYPSCRYSHAAIDGLLELKEEIGFHFKELEDVEIGLSNTALNIIGVPLEEKRNPKNIVDGQFSMPFCAAIAAKNGSFVWDDYKNSLTDNETLSLCKRIKTAHDKKAEECCPAYMSANAVSYTHLTLPTNREV